MWGQNPDRKELSGITKMVQEAEGRHWDSCWTWVLENLQITTATHRSSVVYSEKNNWSWEGALQDPILGECCEAMVRSDDAVALWLYELLKLTKWSSLSEEPCIELLGAGLKLSRMGTLGAWKEEQKRQIS